MEQSQDLNIDLTPKPDTSKLQVTMKHHFPHTILLKKPSITTTPIALQNIIHFPRIYSLGLFPYFPALSYGKTLCFRETDLLVQPHLVHPHLPAQYPAFSIPLPSSKSGLSFKA